MPVVVESGIVTRFVNYRENDRILTILTPGRGRIDARARGCRRPTSPLLPCAEPFVFGEFELFSGKDRNTVNSCTVTERFFPIREDIIRFAVGTSMVQLATETIQPNEPNEPQFFLLYHALSFLAYGTSDPMDLFCCYLIRFLDLAGFRPAITTCGVCGRDVRGDDRLYFGYRPGGTVCAACMRGERPISKIALEALRRMLLLSDGEMDRVQLKPALRKEIFAALTDYASHSLEFGPRALAFLQQIPDMGE